MALLITAGLVLPGSSVEASAMPVAGPGRLVTVEPCRLLDTRQGDGRRLDAGQILTVAVAARCDVPAEAIAVALTVAVSGPTGWGYATIGATGLPLPATSTLNWSTPMETRANGTVVALGVNGSIDVSASTAAHLIVDVSGYFVPARSSREGRFVALEPRRLLDTRTTSVDGVAAGSVQRVQLPADVPSDAVAVFVNLTTTASRGYGYFTAHAAGTACPIASVLNTDGPGQTRAAGVIVPVSAAGFDVYSSTGGQLIADVSGYFTGPTAAESTDGLLMLAAPTRVMDTRSDGRDQFWWDGSQGLDTTPITGPASAIVANFTITHPFDEGFVTAFASNTAQPDVSLLNADRPGQTAANVAVVPAGAGGLYIHSSTAAHVVVDLIGWFTGQPVSPSPMPHVLSNKRPPPPPGPDCSSSPTGRAAIVDRIAQQVWLCEDGVAVTQWMPFTAGPNNDAPAGEYRVFFKSDPWYGGGYTLRHFTAFTRGDQGGRVAFHQYVAMRECEVGTEPFRGASHGCFRMRANDAAVVYSFLGYGDRVQILNNG